MDFSNQLFKNHHYAILGLGKNGIAAAFRLLELGATIQLWDDQVAQRNRVPASLKPYMQAFHDLTGFNALVLSPGIPHHLPKPHPVATMAIEQNIPIISDAELLYQAVRKSGSRARFVAVTGTNGKSTTTVLLTHILNNTGITAVAGGNLGPAALSLPYLDDHGVYVLEMSSYMLERLPNFTADIACLLNLTPDHLERHGTMDGYMTAKCHIFDRQTPRHLAIIGIEDDICRQLAEQYSHTSIPTLKIAGIPAASADLWVDHHHLQDNQGIIADLDKAPLLPGDHNAQNTAAATAMALTLGVKREQIEPALISFGGLAHRQRPVATLNQVTFINDSKATNADAASKALTCYSNLVWIAGGMAKTNGIEDLVPYFPRIKLALLIGKDAERLADCLTRHHVPTQIVGTLDQAVPISYKFACQNHVPIVLLSPACASFDQFKNFEDRGETFINLVETLKHSVIS